MPDYFGNNEHRAIKKYKSNDELLYKKKATILFEKEYKKKYKTINALIKISRNKKSEIGREIRKTLEKIILTEKDIPNLLSIKQEQETLYKDIIYPAFKKLAEQQILHLNKKLDDPFNDLRNDIIAHLTFEVMPAYDVKQKPFPWFNMCSKHEILQLTVVKPKKKVKIVQVYRKDVNSANLGADENTLTSGAGNVHDAFIDDSYKTTGENGYDDFFNFAITKLEKIKSKSEEQQERIFLDNIIMILQNKENIDIFKKQELYIILRSVTGFKPREITKYTTKLKEYYKEIYQQFYKNN